MFPKENLHHAYFIEGDRAAVFADIEAHLEKAFGMEKQGNPDFFIAEYDSLGIGESRMLQDMQSLRPVMGDRKAFLVGADSITSEAQNSLLKVFEEPSPGTHFFIVSSSRRILLPTLRSRMVVIEHPSSREKSYGEDARKFLSLSPKQRIDFVGAIVESKDKARAEGFLQALVAELSAKGTGKGAAPIKEILSMIRYLKDRAPSVKLILERTALLDI